MKLSQIRLLSWGIALLGAFVCVLYGLKAYRNLESTYPNAVQPVEFLELTEIPDQNEKERLGRERLMQALAFITKVTPPPPPLKTVEKVTVKAPEPPPPPLTPPPSPFDPKLTLLMVAWDENVNNRYAFVKHEKESAHPFVEGDKLPANNEKEQTTLKKVFRDSILVVNEEGQQKQIYTASAIIQKVARSRVVPAAKTAVINVPDKNGGTKKVSTVPKTRRVPRSRSVNINKDYGISIVEYDQTPDGEKRFAISKKDLKTLQNQSLRLMSEVFMQSAYNDNGDPMGIKFDFVSDEPLAKQYGIQNGDILTHVDGNQVTDAYQAEGIYNNINSKTRRVQISLLRGGTPINIWFEMDDFPGTPNRK